jgi:hypothetical protein
MPRITMRKHRRWMRVAEHGVEISGRRGTDFVTQQQAQGE